MTEGTSTCGCVWTRHPDYGDVIVWQCPRHYEDTRGPRGRAAAKAADERVEQMRREGKFGN